MLQWMGGSRRKVNTSRKSTQKRQKQYFEQRKRQQNLQMRSDDCSDVLGMTGQYLKERRSLDILNLVNLSTNTQKCNSASLKEEREVVKDGVSAVLGNIATIPPITFMNTVSPADSCKFEETRTPLGGCQKQTSPKAFVSSPSYPNRAFNGSKPSHQNTMTEHKIRKGGKYVNAWKNPEMDWRRNSLRARLSIHCQ